MVNLERQCELYDEIASLRLQLKAAQARVSAMEEALAFIDALPIMQINLCKYDHDDVCALNKNAIQAALVARATFANGRDEMSDKLLKKMFEHSAHPVTGKMVLTNPDGPAAADEIERLRAEMGRLRQALLDIFDYECRTSDQTLIACTARDALWPKDRAALAKGEVK